jgi:hypothetical protein
VLVHALFVCASLRADTSLQIRIAWGGGADRQWSGAIALTEGQLGLHRPLGVEADEPGSIWADGNRVEIRQRSTREYDGVDLFVEAPLGAKLFVSLAADARSPPVNHEIVLSELLGKPISRTLDDHGNRLLVRRAPGDMLRVRCPRDSLVFATGERVTIDLKPHLLPISDAASVRIRSRLIAKATGAEHWSQEHQLTRPAGDSTSPAIVTLDFVLPQDEGVYDLVIEASERNPLRWSKPIVSRHVQLVAISDQPAAIEVNRQTAWTKVSEIDPANPAWTDRLKNWPLIPGWRRGPLGSGQSQTVEHALGPVIELAAVGRGTEMPWEAYPLGISKPGMPHLLEVEFPGDVEQSLGISIVEPNAAGVVAPVGLDSGFYSSPDAAQPEAQWRKHRLVFWPRTKSPLLLLTNQRGEKSAMYGKIRVLAGPQHLPAAFHPVFDKSERLFAAYLDRPLFCENFGATESLDAWSGRSLDDWQTFYEGSTRLVEYMNHVGYNGLMLAVWADGSTIYPGALLEPTPRYDTGPFFDSGQDPFRKDVLELLLRQFDRVGGKLIPTLQFSTPLPALEALLRQSDPQASGIVLIGPDGKPWTASQLAKRGLAPYYNPLNPHVQDAMLAVVRELVERYGRHPAFAGLAIELSAYGYAQLPGEQWGLDDATVAEFERDTRVRVPGNGPDRFAARARFLLGDERQRWLEWRAANLADFHHRLARELAAVRPDATFYLAAANMFDTPEAQRDLRPALPGRTKLEDVLLTLGIQPQRYRANDGLVFLRPQRILPPGPIVTRAVEMELERSAELDQFAAASAMAGSLLFHEPQKEPRITRLTSFDAKSPFGKDKTYTWLVAQLTPAGSRNRERFVKALARLDSAAVFDGGWLLPLGQEQSLARLIAAYRRLPAERFTTLATAADGRSLVEPVTVRTAQTDGRTYAYFVNESAWPVSLSMQVSIPPGIRLDELSGLRRLPAINGKRWTLDLEPFDLVAVRFASTEVRFEQFAVTAPDEVRRELERRIDELRHRRAVLHNPPPLAGPPNADFETSARNGEPAGWTVTGSATGSAAARIERQGGNNGTSAVRLSSNGPAVSLVSDSFAPPETGRLSLSVYLRVAKANQQPTLRLAIEGTSSDGHYSPFAMVGAGTNVAPIGAQWSEYILKIDDVPASGLSPLRVRFDLVGAGEVWIDDVQLLHLLFADAERDQLAKLLELPAFQLQEGKWGECLRELDSYWPRFLLANVPLAQQPLVTRPEAEVIAPQGDDKHATRPGMMDRMKDWLKR